MCVFLKGSVSNATISKPQFGWVNDIEIKLYNEQATFECAAVHIRAITTEAVIEMINLIEKCCLARLKVGNCAFGRVLHSQCGIICELALDFMESIGAGVDI